MTQPGQTSPTVEVDGRKLITLLDTGSEVDVFINAALVNERKRLDKFIQVSFANGDKETLLLDDLHLKSNFVIGTVSHDCQEPSI